MMWTWMVVGTLLAVLALAALVLMPDVTRDRPYDEQHEHER